MKRILSCLVIFAAFSFGASAQTWSVGTNLVGYADLGTLNVEASHAFSRHFTVNLDLRVNPWTFHEGDSERQFQNRKQSYNLGARWWPWYCYSGWWVAAGAQYQEYNRGGLFKQRQTEEGDAFGGSFSAGYSWLLSDRWDIEIGLSGWAGRTKYTTYACPQCGRVVDSGTKTFILPNDAFVNIVFIF